MDGDFTALAHGQVFPDHSPQDMNSFTDDQLAQLQGADFPLFDTGFDSSPDDMFHADTPQTVSPQELSLDHSNPPSSALTNMSTPGMDYEHSPFLRNDSALLTPASAGFTGSAQDLAYLDGDLDASGMYSLFPEEPADLSRATTAASATEQAHAASHAAINGVKSRSRSKPLPAIESSMEDDPTTAKRKRNTMAARKSREKKQAVLSTYERENDDLKALLAQWKSKAESAERRSAQLETRLRQLGA